MENRVEIDLLYQLMIPHWVELSYIGQPETLEELTLCYTLLCQDVEE